MNWIVIVASWIQLTGQVEAFRYNANGVEALRHLIHGAEVA
ncbi:hypothetical protein ACMVCI_003926 [Yersinia enterocolitica]|nr:MULTISPECIES: hypothetical protein [Yersinia]